MNNTCPSCGATYNITAAMIGREVVCKKCNSELVITEAGIELKDAPPPPPARRGSSGFNVGPAAPSRRPAARVQEEPEEEEGYDEEEESAPRKSSRYGKSGGGRKLRSSSGGEGGFADFATFKTLITPTVIVIIYWIFTGLAVLGGLVIAGLALSNGVMMGALGGLLYIVIGPFIVRLYCELIIVAFRIYTTLGEILTELKSQR